MINECNGCPEKEWKGWAILGWVLAITFFTLLIRATCFAGTRITISAMANDDLVTSDAEFVRESDIWDSRFRYSNSAAGGVGISNKFWTNQDLWIARGYEPLKHAYLELTYEFDNIKDYDKASVYLGWLQPVKDWYSFEVYLGAYEYTQWAFSLGASSKLQFKFKLLGLGFCFFDKLALEFPLSNADSPEIYLKNSLDLNVGICYIGYSNEWQLRNMLEETTNRLFLKYEL